MTGGVAESWARLRLVQGDSSAQVWELVASRGQTTLTVGSGPSSSWVIREEGVRPLHFSLHWDGATLRVADTYGAGDVRVDGEPLTAQWRSIVGRARIDFGKGAMVAETSAGAESEAHLLEPSPLPPIAVPASAEVAARGNLHHKATLLGVSQPAEVPVELVTLKSDPPAKEAPAAAEGEASSAASESSPPRGSDSQPPKEGSFRPARPTDSERARKATLLGIAVNVPPAPAVPDIQVPAEARAEEAPKPAGPSRGIPSGTLIGVVGPLEARVQRLASAAQDPKLSDKRTILGVPLKDLRVGEPAGPQAVRAADSPGIVTQAEVRAVSSPPPAAGGPAERIGSTWQEIPNAPRQGGGTPMAVLVDGPGAANAQTRADNDVGQHPYEARNANQFARGFEDRSRAAASSGFSGFDTRDRVSDIPTQMRDMASLDSRRPRRTFPLRYVGIVILTAAAYMAWLYLLDHL